MKKKIPWSLERAVTWLFLRAGVRQGERLPPLALVLWYAIHPRWLLAFLAPVRFDPLTLRVRIGKDWFSVQMLSEMGRSELHRHYSPDVPPGQTWVVGGVFNYGWPSTKSIRIF